MTNTENAKEISGERRSNLVDLITIIEDINESTASLFLRIMKYLEILHTGRWIFPTGNSRLNNHLNKALNEFDAVELDGEVIRKLKAQKSCSIVPSNSESYEQYNTTEETIHYLRLEIESYKKEIRKLEIRLEEKDEKITELLRKNKMLSENNVTFNDAAELQNFCEAELIGAPQTNQFSADKDNDMFMQGKLILKMPDKLIKLSSREIKQVS